MLQTELRHWEPERVKLVGSDQSSQHTQAPPWWPWAAEWLCIWCEEKALDLFQARACSRVVCLCGLLASPSTVQGLVGASCGCLTEEFLQYPPFSLHRSCMRWCWETYQHLSHFLRRDLATSRQFLSAISDLPSAQAPLVCYQLCCGGCLARSACFMPCAWCSHKPRFTLQAIGASFGPKQQFISKVRSVEYSWAKL